MAHRLHQLHKKKVEHVDTQPETTQPESSYSPTHSSSPNSKPANHRGLRPIFEPTNFYKLYEKQSYKKGDMTLPPP